MVEQFIRPTGLVDPPVEVRPTLNQIDDLVEEIEIRAEADERVLVTTLTKRMAEELYKYFDRMGIRCRYIHSDVDTLERVQIHVFSNLIEEAILEILRFLHFSQLLFLGAVLLSAAPS